VCKLSHFDDKNEIKDTNDNNELESNHEDNSTEINYSDEDFVIEENVEQTVSKYELSEELERLQANFNKQVKKRFISGTLAGVILGSAITFGATYAFLPNILSIRGISFSGNVQEITINPTQDLTVYSAVARKVMPSVVGITTIALQRDQFYGVRQVSGVGTGVIVDARGYILTNSHVIGDGNVEEVIVLLNDGKQLKAEVLWNEISLDLAIIKVEGQDLTVAELGDSDLTEVGEIAIAIGNPLGLTFERTLTQGVISGLNRTITVDAAGETIENLMQTDASINPGNSGGPLLNAKGQVIGINTAKISTGEGLGFAIPINIAKPIVDQFIEKGEFTRVYLGIQGVNIDVFESATRQEAPVDSGVYVIQIIEDSVATKYGIQPNDVIIKIGEDKITRMSNLVRSIYKYRPGDETTITVIRNNQEVEIDIVFE